MTAIRPAIRSAIQPAIRSAFAGSYGWLPTSLFAAGEQGVWYDPSDFSTMYQDSAGTTPVTAVGDPVGLILDKSDGLVLGSELAPSSTFDSSSGWAAVSNWTISGGSAAHTSGKAASLYTTAQVLTVGKTYQVTVSATVSASTITVQAGNAPSSTISASGTYTFRLTCATDGYIRITPNTLFVGSIESISYKELPGNHATQATAASRLLSATGGAVDFDGTDDSVAQSDGGGSTTGFMLVAAIKPEGGAGTVRNIWSDTGTNTGYVVRINASNQLEMAVGNGSAYTTVATTATLDVGTAYVVSAWDDGTNLNVQINSGTVASATRPTVSAGSSTATIGKSNTSAASYFNGLMYQVLQTKNDGGTDAERTEAKAYCATKGGVTL